MNTLVKWVDTTLKWGLVLLMLAMVIDVSWQVMSRYLLQKPSSYTEEIARFLLIWISFLGASYAYRQQQHLGIDLLTAKLEGNKKRWASLFSYGVCGVFALLVLSYGGSQLVLLTLELQQVSGALGLPMFYIYSVIPLSGFLMLFYSAYFICQQWQQEPS
jgi:TRAP-type C4-dicarboxylate transport system permease small subunit